MKIELSSEVLAVEDGTYKATVDNVLPYGDDGGVLMKLALDDGRMLISFTTVKRLGEYPWGDVFRALATDDTDDLIGETVEITVENTVSETSGNSFCNIKRVKLLPRD